MTPLTSQGEQYEYQTGKTAAIVSNPKEIVITGNAHRLGTKIRVAKTGIV
jgi:energy-converting hydrogenase Eha subunit F